MVWAQRIQKVLLNTAQRLEQRKYTLHMKAAKHMLLCLGIVQPAKDEYKTTAAEIMIASTVKSTLYGGY